MILSHVVCDGQFDFVTIYKVGKFGIKAYVPNAKSCKLPFFYSVVETKTELRNVNSELWGEMSEC